MPPAPGRCSSPARRRLSALTYASLDRSEADSFRLPERSPKASAMRFSSLLEDPPEIAPPGYAPPNLLSMRAARTWIAHARPRIPRWPAA